ncbi:MAG TPA: single-stranded-DNA-specific exonuclease RecJ, partial [Negativicutes bacterium]
DVIITDHHQPPEQLPAALAIINPKQPDCTYADKYLAGVGVAFKLCQALWQKKDGTDAAVLEYLDMVAIGTIADIVPLMGENRILVKLGLQTLANTANIGLQALITVCDLQNSKIDTGKVGFVIAPRLNAVGRIGRASTGVELLTVKDATMANELAIHLDNENSARQIVEKEIQDIAETLMADVDLNTAKTLVLAGEDWHSGVIGIVASRLVEKYYRPVVMISVKDGIGKGSCRSIAGFDIYDALYKCADLLIQFGGHRQAAGLSILPENIAKLRERLNQIAAETLTEEDYIPVLNIDSFVPLEEINTAFLEQLSCLAPHGMGNPSPVFACEELLIADLRSIGQGGRHLKLKIKRNQISSDVIAWNMGSWVNELQRNSCIDLAFLPEINEWQGQRSIQLKAHDVRQTVKKAMIEQSDHRCITIKDNRNTSDKLGEILQVIKLGEKVLIYVNSDKEAQALVQKLRNCLPEASQQVAGYYQESNHDRNIQVVDKFFEGAIKVVVIAKGVEDTLKLPDVQHVILY